jgi:hypothetical protein
MDPTIESRSLPANRSSLLHAPALGEAWAGLRFLGALPFFLRHPTSPADAATEIAMRLEQRPSNLLKLLRRAVYDNPASPHRWLLRQAGCEFGDIAALIAREGVEGALRELFRSGVYMTVDEFKGKRPVVRGSSTLTFNPATLRNHRQRVYSSMQSSGTSGAPSAPIPLTLDYVRDRAANTGAMLQARGGSDWRQAMWGVPGGGAISYLLQLAGAGLRPARWFSQIDPAARGLHPRYRWSARTMRWASVAAGVPLPAPEHVSLENPLPIAWWMRDELTRSRVPHLFTFSSCAVRVCQAALDDGLRLDGAQFTTSGEALTPARRAAIEATGAKVAACYGIAECGWIGPGCLQPATSDDLHLYEDLHALIQPGAEGTSQELPKNALLISSLSASAGLILLNVCFGDQADVVERDCGCPMAAMGWRRHLQNVRSYEKLTAGGMTFLDTDVITVLEETLPQRFGGGPTDYQLLEEETEDGRARLRLLVHPAIGPLDTESVKEAFLSAIATGSGAEQVMGLQWRDGQLLRVERAVPRNTTRGKILHLYRERPSDP